MDTITLFIVLGLLSLVTCIVNNTSKNQDVKNGMKIGTFVFGASFTVIGIYFLASLIPLAITVLEALGIVSRGY